jgi:DNA-binding NarL/FixJ family response regulator
MAIDAYVHKSSTTEELLATIEAIARDPGEDNVVIAMPRGAIERLDDGPVGSLSERETEVLVLVARGHSNEQIAQELHLATSTIKRHLANIYEKIGVGSRGEAVRMALMEQWIGISEITEEALPSDDFGRDGNPAG